MFFKTYPWLHWIFFSGAELELSNEESHILMRFIQDIIISFEQTESYFRKVNIFYSCIIEIQKPN